MASVAVSPEIPAFLERVRSGSRLVLLLDYDGTLAPFRVERDRALPYPEIPPLLATLSRCGRAALTVVSGRSAREVAPLLGLVPPPEIWGSHGRERLMPTGDYAAIELSPAAEEALNLADFSLAREGLESRVERKFASVAVHWRGLSAAAAGEARVCAYRALAPIASYYRFKLLQFDGGVELVLPDRTKGTVVTEILATISADAAVAYLGDDITDESAFRALGTRGLSVLVRAERRETAAQVWLRPPEELVGFLRACVDAVGGEA